jgi:hypothetical protein
MLSKGTSEQAQKIQTFLYVLSEFCWLFRQRRFYVGNYVLLLLHGNYPLRGIYLASYIVATFHLRGNYLPSTRQLLSNYVIITCQLPF